MPKITGDELEASLFSSLLKPWFPRCVDAEGGFHQSFDREWNRIADSDRFLVFQSRMTWLCATLAETYGGEWKARAEHGYRFLTEMMFRPNRSFIWRCDDTGDIVGPYADQRHSYGMAFAIFALAACQRAIGQGLDEAVGAYHWLDRSARDAEFGGYWECMDASGRAVKVKPNGAARDVDGIGTPYGLKSQNTHLHLVEAFSELYRVWPDNHLKNRLRELIRLMRDRIYAEPGGMLLYVKPDLSPASDKISYGHDIEAMHLLYEAGQLVDEPVEVRSLVDNALATGWDSERGGFYNLGYPGGDVIDKTKVWWVQAEGLVALAKMDELFGAETSKYADALDQLWDWCKLHQIDATFGGWYEELAESGELLDNGQKGHAWKAAYHDGRALLFTSRLLKR